MRTLTVITAGLSTPSSTRQVAEKIADSVSAAVTSRGEALTVEVFEVSELINDLAQVMSTGISSPRLDEVKEHLSASDGLIAVTPIFKASYSGVFKMFFDALDTDALNGMPTIIAATAGTARHSLALEHALRPLLVYLRADVMPTSLFAATEDFGSASDEFSRRVHRAAGELASRMLAGTDSVGGLGGVTAEGQVTTRRRSSGVDPEENVTPFTELLKRYGGNPQ
ncbi:oxidoreductase [Corynebacterium yudongzhengii]|uniref:Oxidoreductase n=1 Tax=Corynebacterium yudongzhengii TaxID=2080740 RepID=A0A2U1T7L1_9CORY|nr:FMN reductase [Corynebacterium yudongzhengii]AWB81811.1 oxidoreductase [Corynebacterium yudongzhengii]PWC01987.1 oxidoreductase [Corynebacterium yudongzhengii]